MQELFFKVTRLGSDYFQRIRMFSRNVRLLILSQFCIGLGMTFFGLLFNLYLQEAGRDKVFIGYVLALSHITTAIVALPAGYLAALFATTGSIAWAGSAMIFGRVLNGNYTIAFFIAAGLYTIAATLFYLFFRKAECPPEPRPNGCSSGRGPQRGRAGVS